MEKRNNPDINIAIIGLDYHFALEVAKQLSDRLDMFFLDSMGLYEFDISPITLTEIIGNMGISYFRKEQRGNVKYVSTFSSTVIAFESGVVLDNQNLDKIDKSGLICYIHQSTATLLHQYNINPCENKFLDRLYHLNIAEINERDKILQDKSEIVVDASDGGVIKCVSSLLREIKKYYNMNDDKRFL